MSFTSESSPAQRVPAWKRLGLKLKAPPAAGTGAQPAATAPAARPSANNKANQSDAGSRAQSGQAAFENRRKRFPSPSTDGTPGNKRVRFDTTQQSPSYQNGRKSFGGDSKDGPGYQNHARRFGGETTSLSNAKDQAAAKKKKPKKSKPAKELPPPSLADQHLEYLRRYKDDKASWKFNKNSQTLLIKYVFIDDLIPAPRIDAFYDYIQDLKGIPRTRLLETAKAIIKEDQKANAGFGEKSEVANKEALVKMQAEYDGIVAQLKDEPAVNGNGKRPRRISEVEYVLRTTNTDIQRRLRRRIRAENVAAELSDSESSTSSGGATTTTSASTSTGAGSSTAGGHAASEADDTDVKMDMSGAGAPKKKMRKKKQRVNMMDEDSSSEEDSDDESSSEESSSSSSEDESEDEEMPLAGVADAETSSSSSSSSEEGSEEEDSEDDDDSSEEENNAGGGAQI